MYNFFLGDIHMISQINKILSFHNNACKEFYSIYFECVFSLLKDYLEIINKYNTKSNNDISEIEKLNFIDIKDD